MVLFLYIFFFAVLIKIYLVIYTLFLFPQSGKTLSARRWNSAFNEEGRLDIAKVLRRIQRGVTYILYSYIVYHCIAGLFVSFSVCLWVYNYSDNYRLIVW